MECGSLFSCSSSDPTHRENFARSVRTLCSGESDWKFGCKVTTGGSCSTLVGVDVLDEGGVVAALGLVD